MGHDAELLAASGAGVDYPKNGQIAKWLLVGNANDSSGFAPAADGVVTNATPTTDRYGAANSAYLFNGAAERIDFGDVSKLELDTFTILSFVKRDSIGTEDTFYSQQHQSSSTPGVCGLIFRFDSSNQISAIIAINNSFEFITSTGLFTDTSGFYLASLTKEGTAIEIGINGISVKTGTVSSATIDYTTSSSKKTVIGARWNGQSSAYVGNLNGVDDDTVVYNRKMDMSEILDTYNLLKA